MILSRVIARWHWPLVAGMLVAFAQPSAAAAQTPTEYEVQAAYVSKFLSFTEWPDDAARAAALVIAVVGGEDFVSSLRAVDGYTVGKRKVEVRVHKAGASLEGVHVLVLAPDLPESRVRAALESVGDQPVLTVSRADGFADRGGIVEFVLVDGSLRFDVNMGAAEGSKLKLSSRLLRVARNVIQP